MKFASLIVCAAVSAASLAAPAFAGSDSGFSADARKTKTYASATLPSHVSKAQRREAVSQDRVCYAQAGGCTGLPSYTKQAR